MNIIGFAGKAGAGKDTCADYLISTYAHRRAALAQPLKTMLHAGLGLDPADYQTLEQKEAVIPWLGVSYRHAAQSLGTDWGRKLINPDVWLLCLEKFVVPEMQKTDCPGLVLSDVRFDNEAAWVRRMGGTLIHVISNRGNGMPVALAAHASESGVAVDVKDRLLFNYGSIAELHLSLDAILESVWGGR